jgi:hypothetical protein
MGFESSPPPCICTLEARRKRKGRGPDKEATRPQTDPRPFWRHESLDCECMRLGSPKVQSLQKASSYFFAALTFAHLARFAVLIRARPAAEM